MEELLQGKLVPIALICRMEWKDRSMPTGIPSILFDTSPNKPHQFPSGSSCICQRLASLYNLLGISLVGSFHLPEDLVKAKVQLAKSSLVYYLVESDCSGLKLVPLNGFRQCCSSEPANILFDIATYRNIHLVEGITHIRLEFPTL